MAQAVTLEAVIKAADESVTSSTTLQDDNELTLAVGAGETWEFEFLLLVTGASAGDIKLGLTVPAGTSGWWGGHGIGINDINANTQNLRSMAGDLTAVLNFGTPASAECMVVVRALVITTNAGSVTLQWAQNASSGTATTVKAGSVLRATPLVDDARHDYVLQASDVSASANFQIDTDLQFTIGATEKWEAICVVRLECASSSPDVKFDFSPLPTSAIGRMTWEVLSANGVATSSGGEAEAQMVAVAPDSTRSGGTVAAVPLLAVVHLLIIGQGTGGTVKLTFAQLNTTPASPVTVKQNSYMKASRIS
jgi:hypothetical protein